MGVIGCKATRIKVNRSYAKIAAREARLEMANLKKQTYLVV